MIEMCGMWEGCCLEGGKGAPVSSIIATQLMEGGAAADEDEDEEDGEQLRDWLTMGLPGAAAGGGGGGGEPFAPGSWLGRELAAASLKHRLMRDGWQALQFSQLLDTRSMPRDLANALGVMTAGGRSSGSGSSRGAAASTAPAVGALLERWLSLTQLCFLLGLHRALFGVGEEEDSAGLVGLRWVGAHRVRVGWWWAQEGGCACQMTAPLRVFSPHPVAPPPPPPPTGCAIVPTLAAACQPWHSWPLS